MRKFGQYLLANPLHALVFALFCAILPIVSMPGGFIAAIVVGLVTLSRGYKAGFIVLIGVAIPVVGFSIWQQRILFDLVLIRCILVWLFAGILGKTGSWRLVFEVMTVFGCLVVMGFHLVLTDTASWWLALIKQYGSYFTAILAEHLSEDKVQQLLAQLAPIATGLFTALVLLGVFCQLLIARWWQANIYRPGGLAKEFVEIRNGPLLAILLTLIFIAELIGIKIASDLLPVVLLPFVIVGLSILHKWSRVRKEFIFLLVMVYIGLIFLPLLILAILALAGYIDCWYDLRKRFFIAVR